MEQIQIVYATKTQHSKKIAEAMSTALNTKAENINTNPVIINSTLLFIVGGIYGGKSLTELVTFVNGINGQLVKKVVLITSCVSEKQGQATIRQILETKGITVCDELICPGNFLFIKLGHPNKEDLKIIINFASEAMERFKA